MVDSGGRALRGEDLPVVEADDGDLAGNVNARLVQRVQHATGDLVGAGEDRVERRAFCWSSIRVAPRPHASVHEPK